MANHILLTLLCLGMTAVFAHGADLYVDPNTGDDAADGRSAPVRTIARAVRLAGPGDTVHLAKAVYRESVDLTGKSGERERPLVIDGHDAVIEGSRDIAPSDWQEVGPGLYRNTTLFEQPLRRQEEWVWRWFFLFDGKMNRMGRCMKGTNAPYKNPADLSPGEWTYQQNDGHAFYVRIDPAKKLGDCRIATPWLVNGVSVHGANHHLVIRNLTATHVLNDGYNISPARDTAQIRDVLFENIRSIECGDDGLSAHGNSTVRVDGFYSTRNGTGLCTTGNSANNRLLVRDNVGYEVYFYPYPYPGPTAHAIANSRIECRADNGCLIQGGKNPDDLCLVKLNNVVIQAMPGGPPRSSRLALDQRARLEGQNLTLAGLALTLGVRGASISDSVIAGGAAASIEIASDAAWEARRNVFDIAHLRLGLVTYTATQFEAYQRASGQDTASKWEPIDVAPLLASESHIEIEGKPVGAAVQFLPQHP